MTPQEYLEVLNLALKFKRDRFFARPLLDKSGGSKSVAVIFDKNSTRTRASFSIGITELGGYPLVIDANSSQLSRGEPISDTAHVLERMVEAIVWRTFGQENVIEMAKNSSKPVVNALTDTYHPCQVLADLAAFAHLLAPDKIDASVIQGKTLVYLGDGANNMAHSYLLGCATAGVNVRIACPAQYSPQAKIVARAVEIGKQTGASIEVLRDAEAATQGADLVTTDAWLSMGDDESQKAARAKAFLPYQVNANLIKLASPKALFMHCLPAYRGSEVTAEIIDGFQSAIFEEAEFRLHAQKALLTFLLR